MQPQYDTLIDRVIRDGIKNYCYRRVECGADRDQRAREHRQEWVSVALPGFLAQPGVKHGRLLSAGAVDGWMTKLPQAPTRGNDNRSAQPDPGELASNGARAGSAIAKRCRGVGRAWFYVRKLFNAFRASALEAFSLGHGRP